MRYAIFVFATLCFSTSMTGASTYTVNADGSGDFPTIQAAIEAVVDGDVIELTDGTFTGDGNRDLDYLAKAITVRSQSDNPEACIIDCGGSATDPHRGFRFHHSEGAASRLEGVKIINGWGIADTCHIYPHGGAIDCDFASPTIVNCVFSDCEAGDAGGGIACWEASPILTGCSFRANRGERGAGMSCLESCHPTLTDCAFSENIADYFAGAIYCWGDFSIVYTRCTFEANESVVDGGAMFTFGGTNNAFTECVFADNSSVFGGAFNVTGAQGLTFTDCTFQENTAYRGGALDLFQSSSHFFNCMFHSNEADVDAGGIYSAEGPISLYDCTFIDHVANHGGALSFRDAVATVCGCTLVGGSGHMGGGGVYCSRDSEIKLQSTIIAFGTEGAAVYCNDGSNTVLLTCCDLYGNAGGDWVGYIEDQLGVAGNISADPIFCAPAEDDFTLSSDSPCAPQTPPNPECGLIGAWPVGCGGTPVVEATWGGIKSLFRK